VTWLHARFGVAITISLGKALHGGFRQAMIDLDKKGFYVGKYFAFHLTKRVKALGMVKLLFAHSPFLIVFTFLSCYT